MMSNMSDPYIKAVLLRKGRESNNIWRHRWTQLTFNYKYFKFSLAHAEFSWQHMWTKLRQFFNKCLMVQKTFFVWIKSLNCNCKRNVRMMHQFRCQFHQHFKNSFYVHRYQKRKKDIQFRSVFLCVWGLRASC